MTDLYRVKHPWHSSLPVGSIFTVGPLIPRAGYRVVRSCTPGVHWPAKGAQWDAYNMDHYLELAEGPW